MENFAFWFSQQTKNVYFWSTGIIVYVFWVFFPFPCGMKKPEIPFGLTQLMVLFQDKTLHFLKNTFLKKG